ncbi:MAG TPA: hypothetical protein VGQ65_15720 [Thermoanaerobaculia bacterium]|jgi:hypothetical protein|nr:hypothetical protein [Thermoanaerobaculia bacterium]
MPLSRAVGVTVVATLFLAPFTARGQFVQQGQEPANCGEVSGSLSRRGREDECNAGRKRIRHNDGGGVNRDDDRYLFDRNLTRAGS